MCFPDFIESREVSEGEPLTGYRGWLNPIKNNLNLKSENQNYIWKSPVDGPHLVKDKDSGLYAYNYYNYNYYNSYYNNYDYYNYYNSNYNYYNNYNYNYYYLGGIIYQFGKVAIHSVGQRSEYAKIDKLFTIRDSNAKGPQEFLNWIKTFNEKVEKIAEKYNAKTIHWQDFIENA